GSPGGARLRRHRQRWQGAGRTVPRPDRSHGRCRCGRRRDPRCRARPSRGPRPCSGRGPWAPAVGRRRGRQPERAPDRRAGWGRLMGTGAGMRRFGARGRTPGAGQRGSASVELVLATPVLVALMLLAVAGGRLASARGEVDAAARDSARAASLARSGAAAERDGRAAAEATLADRHVICRDRTVTIDLTDFQPGGTVTSTVTCAVELRDLTGLGLP